MNNYLALKPRHLVLALASIGLAASLVACGGGGGGSATSTGKLTSVYFTDDFSAEHDAVWITVTRVTVVSPTGETQLAAFNPGQSVNLPTLRRTGALMAVAAVPADATSVRVYVGSTAQLQQLDGSLRNVSLQAPAGYLEFRLEGWNSSSGALALDFDLPKFVLQGNTLVPSTRVASNDDFAGWNQRYAEVEGSVTAITDTSLSLTTKHHGSRTVALDANTTFISKRSASWRPAVGDKVEIYSAVVGQGTDGLQLTARAVKDETQSGTDTIGLNKVDVVVSAVSGTLVTANVTKSKNAGLTGSVVFDIASAYFKRGSAGLIVPGVKVEAYLVQQGNAWVASAIEIQGAAKSDDGRYGSYQSGYSELKGIVVSTSGSTATVRVASSKGLPGLAFGAQVSVDLSNAYYERGAASCLMAGVPVELKGAVNAAGVFQPVRVEIEGACAVAAPVAGVTQPAPSGSAPTGPMFVEAKGTVTAVRAGEFDMSVYRLEYGAADLSAVTVRHDATTVFKRATPATLAAGNFVEVKGSLQGSLLSATKVELE